MAQPATTAQSSATLPTDQDWPREDERQRTVKAIPGAKVETVANGGHFLSLDQPERLAELIKSFTDAKASQAARLSPQ